MSEINDVIHTTATNAYISGKKSVQIETIDVIDGMIKAASDPRYADTSFQFGLRTMYRQRILQELRNELMKKYNS